MDVTARKPAEAGDTFRHHTGREYAVIAIARDDDEQQDLVIHRGLHDGRIWSRPMKNFMDYRAEGQPRFVWRSNNPVVAPSGFSREEYEDIEGYAVAAMIGNLSCGGAGHPTSVARDAFDVAQALLAEKKKRLGEKPDYNHGA